MQFSLDHSAASYTLRSYLPGKLQINDTVYTQNLIISPHTLIESWPVSSISNLKITDLTCIEALHPEVVLLGTGSQLIYPHPALLAYFTQRRIGIEVMNTAAACRTFIALASEGREVVAALFI